MYCLSHNDITRRVLSAGVRGASSLSEPIPISTWKSAKGLPAATGNWELGLCWLSSHYFRHSCKLSKCTVLKSGQGSGCSLPHPPGISCGSCFVLQLNTRCLAQNLRGVLGSGQDSGLRFLVILHEVHQPMALVLISVTCELATTYLWSVPLPRSLEMNDLK